MRERIYELVNLARPGDRESKAYDWFITLVSALSLVPLMFKTMTPALRLLDTTMVYFLFMDYVMRWMVHDYMRKRPGDIRSFIIYPFSVWAVFDLLAILPSLGLVPKALSIFRVLRVTKVMRYSKSFQFVSNVFKQERKTLGTVFGIAFIYLFISALVMFSYEPDTFGNFFDALYWATTALTTVGYGDIYPKTELGRLISMISSMFGIAVIALPAGIITAGFMQQLQKYVDASAAETKSGDRADRPSGDADAKGENTDE